MYRFTTDNGAALTAVLISPGYGAGWATWNDSEIATDSRLIEWLLSRRNHGFQDATEDTRLYVRDFLSDDDFDEFESFVCGLYEGTYCGGIHQLCIVFVPQGTLFRVNEYDGSESIETLNTDNWTIA